MRPQWPIFTAVLALLLLPETTSASQGGTAALVRPVEKSQWTPGKKDPYNKLFAPPRPSSTQAAPSGSTGKPEIKCGMTVIQADPSIDPRMAITPPSDGITFSIRAIEPTLCR